MNANEVAVEYTKALINGNVKAQDHFGSQIIDSAPSMFRAAHAAADVINAEDQLWRAQLLDSAKQTVLNKKGCSDFVANKAAELSEVAAEIGKGLTQNEYGNPIDARCLSQCLDANKHMLHFNNKESEVSHDAAYYAELLSSYAPRSENWHELGQAMALKDLEKLIEDPNYQPDNISPESLKSTHEEDNVGPKAVARDIKDFEFESGVGEYTADISVGADEFSVDLYYEYGMDPEGFWKFGESDGAELDNETSIEMAAEKAGVGLDEADIEEIISELESQVENFVKAHYSDSMEAKQEEYKKSKEEREQEYDGMSM